MDSTSRWIRISVRSQGATAFEADLAFYSARDNAVLLVEETENPEPKKEDQLRAYLCVDKAVLAHDVPYGPPGVPRRLHSRSCRGTKCTR